MGGGAYVVPMLLAGVGAALVLRPFVHYPGQLNGGAVLLVAGILLALAAQTAGLGPQDPVRDGYFQPDFFTAHGGALGEVLYWASATLLQRAGAHIIALLLIVSGALLLSGRPIAGLLRSAGDASRRAQEATGEFARTALGGRAGEEGRLEEDYDDGFPTYPLRPASDDAETLPDFDDEADRMTLEEAERITGEDAAITIRDTSEEAVDRRPRGRGGGSRPRGGGRGRRRPRCACRRSPRKTVRSRSRARRWARKRTVGGITESDELEFRLPPSKLLKHGPANDRGPDKARHGQDLDGAARGARPLRRRREAARHRQRPARQPLRAAARSRHQGRQGRAAQGRPRVRARIDRHPHPGADPRQAGGRRRGPERDPQDGPPRRHLQGPPEGLEPAHLLARQGHLRPVDLDRPGEDAAHPDRRHDRLRQVGLRQLDPQLDAAAQLPERAAPGARRPEAGRAQPLRLGSAPADARRHLAAGRRRTCSRT